jgi:hypothetical protein
MFLGYIMLQILCSYNCATCHVTSFCSFRISVQSAVCAQSRMWLFLYYLIMWFIIIIAVKHSTWICDRHGGGHGTHTKLRWQQVLKTVLGRRHKQTCGPFRAGNYMWIVSKCWTSILAVLDPPSLLYRVIVLSMEQWHMARIRRPEIVLPCVSAIFLNSSENCELVKIFNRRWSDKWMKILHNVQLHTRN